MSHDPGRGRHKEGVQKDLCIRVKLLLENTDVKLLERQQLGQVTWICGRDDSLLKTRNVKRDRFGDVTMTQGHQSHQSHLNPL